MDIHCSAQLAFVLGRFLGQDMALERLTTLDGTTGTDTEALLGAALGLHFRHSKLCPLDSSIFSMIAGGSNVAALGCLLSLV